MSSSEVTFYSTLAQVSAAIVGLLGAVLGSRVLDHVSRLRQEKRPIEVRIGVTKAGLLTNRFHANRHVAEEEMAQDTQAINRGASTRGTAQTVQSDFSIIIGGRDIQDILADRAELEEKLHVLEHLESIYALVPNPINDPKETLRLVARLRGEGQNRPEPLKQALGRDAQELESIINDIAAFRRNLLPASFRFMFLLLIWFAATGIFWPLWMLQGGKFIVLFSIGLLGLIGYFFYQFRELAQLGQFQW